MTMQPTPSSARIPAEVREGVRQLRRDIAEVAMRARRCVICKRRKARFGPPSWIPTCRSKRCDQRWFAAACALPADPYLRHLHDLVERIQANKIYQQMLVSALHEHAYPVDQRLGLPALVGQHWEVCARPDGTPGLRLRADGDFDHITR